MKEYSKEVHEFLIKFILPKMNLREYNYDNIGEIVEYIGCEIESPLCNAEECGDVLSEEKSKLLDIATKAITEITTRDDWNKE